jgi:aldose 1-epimerase
MEASNKLYKKNSKAVFKGSNIGELVLDGVAIISGQENETNPLLHGCFLMYPWVGRLINDEVIRKILRNEIVDYPFTDSKGYPLHGFFQVAEREVLEQGDDFIKLTAKDKTLFNYFPKFVESYQLNDKKLEITTTFENQTNDYQYFAYSYHPYIGLNNQAIDTMFITSNCSERYDLTEELVPKVDDGKLCSNSWQFDKWQIGTNELDNMFKCSESDTHVNLTDDNNSVSVISCGELRMPFIQLYTPSNRKSLAIEPMTTPSNSFDINFSEYLIKLEPGYKTSGTIKIVLNN